MTQRNIVLIVLLMIVSLQIIYSDDGYSSIWYPSDPNWVLELKSKSQPSWTEQLSFYDIPNFFLPYKEEPYEPYREQLEFAADTNQLEERFIFGGNDKSTTTTLKATPTNAGTSKTTPSTKQTVTIATTKMPTTTTKVTRPPPTHPPQATTKTTRRTTTTSRTTTTRRPTTTQKVTKPSTSTTTETAMTMEPDVLPYENIYVNPDNCSIDFFFNSNNIRYLRAWAPPMKNTSSVCIWTFYTSTTTNKRFNLQQRCIQNGKQTADGRLFSMDSTGILQKQASLCSQQQIIFESNVVLLSLYLAKNATNNRRVLIRQGEMMVPFEMAFEMQVNAEDTDNSPGYYY